MTSGGDPVYNAKVTVMNVLDGPIFSGNTGEDGTVKFTGCGMDVMVYASKSGYLPDSMSKTLISCDRCGGQEQPGCSSDAQCAADKRCVNGACESVPCTCGIVQNHQCTRYACCADADCVAGMVCQDHVCKQKPAEKPECTSDADCAATKRCDIPVGAAGGNCVEVTGCGTVENHRLIPYECGTEAGCQPCPAGQQCVANKCVASDLEGPETGFVGDNAPLTATEDGKPCANCDLVITDPAGNTITGKTDENGAFSLPLKLAGNYTVALLKDGNPVKQITLQSLPKATPEEGGKPTAIDFSLLLLLFGALLIVIALGIIYWRSRGGK